MQSQFADERKTLLITSILVFLIIMITGMMSVVLISDPAVKYSHILARVATTVHDVYPDSLNWDSSIQSARQSMLQRLDRFSGFVEKEQLEQIEEDLTGGYYGIGVSIIQHDQGLLVMEVREGSPAAKAGLLSGDIIIAADSVSLGGLTAEESTRLVKGDENSILLAAVFRPATSDTLKFDIERQRIEFLHIPFAGFTSDSILYIRLLDFNAGASDDLKEALDSLLGDDRENAVGIILDLRNNPGGLFVEAKKTVELFAKQGSFIVGTDSRSHWRNKEFYAAGSGAPWNLPIVILVNRHSASAAEIVAGALRFSNGSLLIGDTTYGKGLVQGFVRLPEGDGLRLTVSRYYFEGGRYLNTIDTVLHDIGHGLIPDVHYSFVDAHPFYRAIERSLILHSFAHEFQDEIIESAVDIRTRQEWIDILQQYAYDNEFEFASRSTLAARALSEQVEKGELKLAAARVTEIAKDFDSALFKAHGSYIWMRLRQIAYERKYGTYRAYREVVLPEYELIEIAALKLKETE